MSSRLRPAALALKIYARSTSLCILMQLTLSISPHGRLFVEHAADNGALDEVFPKRIEQALPAWRTKWSSANSSSAKLMACSPRLVI